MLGANKNQTIHELLTNMNHLDNHKPYGGLSMIFTGDLKQLGNLYNGSNDLTFFFHRACKRSLYF